MLLNPCKANLATVPGTRILTDTLGLHGFKYVDPKEPARVWELQYLLAPIRKRALGGVRAKFIDNKGFISFMNQRDLEVLVGLAKPGDECFWAGEEYPEVGSQDWFGLCADDDDLVDDLQDRELRLREQFPEILPSNIEIVRRVYTGSQDVEELHILLWDADTETGIGPDSRLETIEKRWVRVERRPLKWVRADE